MTDDSPNPIQPWWRIRMMWLVVGGPVAAVIASFVSLTLAVHGGDRPLLDHGAADADAHAPAMQARNHVATPRR